jgi:hypothetical protein
VLRTPSDTARTPEAIAKLLRDLGPQLRWGGSATAPPPPPLPTGIPELDQLLNGGIPQGRLCEISGPLSSGRTSLALALLARATRTGGIAAIVDAADAFDPPSAEAAGVELERVLWVRAPSLREALRSAESLLAVRGFALLLLDLAAAGHRIAPAAGLRLARLTTGTGTPVVALCLERSLGAAAAVAVELRPTRASFNGTPRLLEELEIEVALVRHCTVPAQRTASVRLRTNRAA